MSEQQIDQLSGVLRETEALILAVRPEQEHDPTPCAEFDVHQLVDHVVGWAHSFAARVSGEESQDDPGSYRTGETPAGEFHEAARTIITGYRAGTPGSQQLPVGIVVADLLTHSWDLARATGRDPHPDPATAELALETVRGMLQPDYRGPGKSFGAEVEVDASAPAIDRLVGFVGRDPGWQPAA